MKFFPCAKINLGLNVVSRRPDGYHNLETVFYPVDIHDILDVQLSDIAGCHLEVVGVKELCAPEDNLVFKAYRLLSEQYDLPGIDVRLTKNLPSQAGMGGGSSDGAYMIRALNEVCSLGMTTEEMQHTAARLGADCAFFITAEPSYAEGIGDELSPVSLDLSRYTLVLIKPSVAVSTREAYAGITPHAPLRNCRDIVTTMPITEWRDCLCNDFEDSIFPRLPILKEVKDFMYSSGALYAAMSGSGSTIFGIFPSTYNANTLSKYAQENKYYYRTIAPSGH